MAFGKETFSCGKNQEKTIGITSSQTHICHNASLQWREYKEYSGSNESQELGNHGEVSPYSGYRTGEGCEQDSSLISAVIKNVLNFCEI